MFLRSDKYIPIHQEGKFISKAKPNFAEIALEMYESVEHASDKERRLLSSTFWREFRIKSKKQPVVERVERILKEQGLNVSVKSGAVFGKEKHDDWIVLNKWPPDDPPIIPPITPPSEWFDKMKTREFGSEREVEYYFILPLLENLGYDEDEIAIGYSIILYDGVHKAHKEADLVTFDGPSREDALLIVEAKNSDKGITVDHIGEVRSYAKELFPACYVITNGQKIMVFRFNGMQLKDEKVMDFERSMLDEKWKDLYLYASKKATVQRLIDRKKWWDQSVKTVI